MSDFFEEPKVEEPVVPVEKIKVGEKEYTQDELSDLVGMGEKTREIESTLNTKIDRVYPEYTKLSQKAKEYEAKIKEYETKSQTPNLDEDSIKQAREAAKKIGIVTEDGFTDFMSKNFRQFYLQERQAEKLLDECGTLEKEFDGSNGQPKFKTEEVLKWMDENGGRNPKQAYKLMYEKEIDEYKQRVLGEAKRPGMVTETTGMVGGKQPAGVKVTRDNIDDLMREALGQG